MHNPRQSNTPQCLFPYGYGPMPFALLFLSRVGNVFHGLAPIEEAGRKPQALSSCFTWESAPCSFSLPVCVCGYWQHLPQQAGVLRSHKESRQSPTAGSPTGDCGTGVFLCVPAWTFAFTYVCSCVYTSACIFLCTCAHVCT